MKRIFISRPLNNESVFLKTLITNGFEVHGESLLVFEAVPFAELPSGDWVFFYSKTAASFFIDAASKTAVAGLKIAAMGPGTARFLTENGYPPHFIGDGDPANTAAAFLQLAAGLRVLFPQARESRQSVQRLLGKSVKALDLVVYENKPKLEINLPDFEVLVFTSPKNAQAYFSSKKWLGEKIVSIGKTTAETLQSLGITKVWVAENPSEAALAELVVSIG